jgi:hypothetical protein
VSDLGDPTSYLELPEGVPVLTAGGEEIGTVAHVLADPEADIFDGIVIDTRRGPGGHRFADASHVDRLYAGGVVLSVHALDELPEPSENPAVLAADPDDVTPDDLGDKLKRAWHWLSGNY